MRRLRWHLFIAMEEGMSQDDLRQDAQRFGEYEVMRDACGGAMLLGSGSYGRTYKARHLLLGTEVAIKVIRRELTASESTRQRFLREGRALAGLTHDHIAMMRYFGRNDDGQLYYAMDYCGGGTLAERVRRLGPRPPGEALDVVRQAALALAAAHAAGIIHRDLKPGNIMLTHTPPPLRVKVIDFGLALSSGSGAAAGRFHGTAQWASPEQLREATLDGRSDLFSLGLVLWFLLEGTIPDQGTTAEVVHGRLSPGGYASRLPQGLPPGIPELLGQLLEIDPSRRPASAVELLGAINALCDAYPYEPVAEQQAVAEDDSGAAELPCLSGAAASDDRYARLTRLHRDLAGEWFMAELEGEGARIVFVLDEQRAENPSLRAKVRANLARLRRQSVDGLPRFAVFYETNSTLVAEWEGNSGDDLISWLRLRNKVRLSDSISFLTRVAEAADDAASCGVPGLGLMASQVRWEYCGSSESGGGLRGAVPRLFPLLLDASDVPAGDCLLADVSGSTLTLASPDLACDRVFMLAKLIYRMVSGREVPDAVAHSPGAYVAVSALSEQGNALMAESLGRGRTWDSCLALLRAIAHAENLSIGGSGTGRTQTSSSGSGSNVRSSALRGQPFPTPPPSKHLSPTAPPKLCHAAANSKQLEIIGRNSEDLWRKEGTIGVQDVANAEEKLNRIAYAHQETSARVVAQQLLGEAAISVDREQKEREWQERVARVAMAQQARKIVTSAEWERVARQREEATAGGGRVPQKRRSLPWIIAACVIPGLGTWAMIAAHRKQEARTTVADDVAKHQRVNSEPDAAQAKETKQRSAPTKLPELKRSLTDGTKDVPNDMKAAMVERFSLIPAGEFVMGDALDGDKSALAHKVGVSAFCMQKTEVSKEQWDKVRAWGRQKGYTDLPAGGGNGPQHPVQTVAWYDVVKWCNAKSEQEGLIPCYYTDVAHRTVYRSGNKEIAMTMVKWGANGYRLPTEAEWEKAARGGLSSKRFPWGNTITQTDANYSSSGTMAVTSYTPNKYGLYDMAGNLLEWCWDRYGDNGSASQKDPRGAASGPYRVNRGGSWGDGADSCRVANRGSCLPSYAGSYVGFRLVSSSVTLGRAEGK